MTIPCTATFIPFHFDVVQSSVGSWAGAIDLSSNHPLGLKNTTTGLNNEITHRVFLAKGTYTVGLYHSTGTDQGIRSLQLDGVQIGTVDGYNASALTGQRAAIAGVTISESRVYSFKLKITGKNASSTNYGAIINAVYFLRTGGAIDDVFTGDYPNGVWYWPGGFDAARADDAAKVVGRPSSNGVASGSYLDVDPVANTHWAEWDLWLPAGAYNLLVVYTRNTNAAIARLELDGQLLGTQNFYGSLLNNQGWTITGIQVMFDGLHTLKLSNPTKDAGSSGYGLTVALFALVRV